jgi:peptidyl-prolyl cis-trans isomerase SurA
MATATSPNASFGRRISLLAAALFVLCGFGAGFALAQEVSIKVLVNDDPISDYDIDQRERFLAITTRTQPSPELKKKATDLLIDERLQIQAGRSLGATADEADVDKVLSDMAAKNNLDVNGLTTALGRAGVNIKTLKDRIRAQLVWQDVVRRKFRHQVNVGDVDVDRALQESADADATETSTQVRQIRVALPSGADQRTVAAKLAAAEAVRARFSNCASVPELAKSLSDATVKTLQSAQTSTLPQPARLLVQHAKAGQMTPPTLSRAAVELYAICGKQSATSSLEVRENTQRKLMNQEMMIHAERLLRDLRQDAFIEYR